MVATLLRVAWVISGMLVLSEGLIRRRPVYVYAFDSSSPVPVPLGVVAMVRRGSVFIASPRPLSVNVPEVGVGLEDVLLVGRVRRELCWDRSFLWPPDAVENLIPLVNSGYAVIIERIAKAPNVVRMYGRAVSEGLMRADVVLSIESQVAVAPTLVGIVQVQGFGRGKPFWHYPRPCLAGRYLNRALAVLGAQVV
ncbi:hypothetical protein [Vulcanisaeta sp. JCM 14467]